jgi:putative membrane protein
MNQLKLSSKLAPLALAAGALACLGGCAHHEDTTRGTIPTTTGSNETSTEIHDGQIAATLDTANRSAIALGELGKSSALGNDVRTLANTMVNELAGANNDLMAILQKDNIQTAESDANKDLMMQANDNLKRLKDAHGIDFDKAFVSAVIDESKKVIDLIDNKLLPNVKNPDLAQKIRDLRPLFGKYLMQAQQIQPAIASK